MQDINDRKVSILQITSLNLKVTRSQGQSIFSHFTYCRIGKVLTQENSTSLNFDSLYTAKIQVLEKLRFIITLGLLDRNYLTLTNRRIFISRRYLFSVH